jgi:energy-coupling factor transporter transmembrane protein EcfT
MPVWLEYRWEDTFLHRMNPIAKLAILGGVMSYAPLVWDLRILLIFGAIGLFMVWKAKIPRFWFYPLLLFVIVRAWAGFIGGLSQTQEGLFRHLPYELTSIAAFTITVPPNLTYGVTLGGLIWAMAITLQTPVTVLFAYSFIYTTGLGDLIQSLSKFKVPQSLLYIIMVGYRFVPYMWRMTMDIIHAQQLRGWAVDSKNPVKIAKKLSPIAYPIARQVLSIIDDVTVSSQVRAFGSGKIVAAPRLKMKGHEKLIAILAIAIFGTLFYLMFLPGVWLGWL